MKRSFLKILISLVLLAAPGARGDLVDFYFTNFNATATKNTPFKVLPVNLNSNGTYVVIGLPITVPAVSGVATNKQFLPGDYQLKYEAPGAVSLLTDDFFFTVDGDTTNVFNVLELRVPTVTQGLALAYSQSAANARFVLKTDGTATGLTSTNTELSGTTTVNGTNLVDLIGDAGVSQATLDATNTALQSSISAKVSKSGDTMTGALTVTNNGVSTVISSNNIAQNVLKPSASTSHSYEAFRFHMGNPSTSNFWVQKFSSFTNANNTVSGGEFDYGFTEGINPNGTANYNSNLPSMYRGRETDYTTGEGIRQSEDYDVFLQNSADAGRRYRGHSFIWNGRGTNRPSILETWDLDSVEIQSRDGLQAITIAQASSATNKVDIKLHTASQIIFDHSTFPNTNNSLVVGRGGNTLLGYSPQYSLPFIGFGPATNMPFANSLGRMMGSEAALASYDQYLLLGTSNSYTGLRWNKGSNRLEYADNGAQSFSNANFTWRPFNDAANNQRSYGFTKVLGQNVGDYVDLGYHTNSSLNGIITLRIDVAGNGNDTLASYTIPVTFADQAQSSTWYEALPDFKAGRYSPHTNDFALDVKGANTSIMNVRLRRTVALGGNETKKITVTATGEIPSDGVKWVTVTGSGSSATATQYYRHNSLTQANGAVSAHSGIYYPSNTFSLSTVTNALTANGWWIGNSNGVLAAASLTNSAVVWTTLPGTGGTGSGETNTASNLGGGYPVYDSKSGVDFRFNSFTNGSGLTTSSNANLFTFSLTGNALNWHQLSTNQYYQIASNATAIAALEESVDVDGSGPGQLILPEDGDTNTVTITAPSSINTNYSITLPDYPLAGLYHWVITDTTNATLTRIANGSEDDSLIIASGIPAFSGIKANKTNEVHVDATLNSTGDDSLQFGSSGMVISLALSNNVVAGDHYIPSYDKNTGKMYAVRPDTIVTNSAKWSATNAVFEARISTLEAGPTTNILSSITSVDIAKEYSDYEITESITVTGLSNVTNTLAQSAVLYLTNSAATNVVLTLPSTWNTTDGNSTYTITNGTLSVLSVNSYGNKWTNAVCTPLF